jgi:hypothetical protein
MAIFNFRPKLIWPLFFWLKISNLILLQNIKGRIAKNDIIGSSYGQYIEQTTILAKKLVENYTTIRYFLKL